MLELVMYTTRANTSTQVSSASAVRIKCLYHLGKNHHKHGTYTYHGSKSIIKRSSGSQPWPSSSYIMIHHLSYIIAAIIIVHHESSFVIYLSCHHQSSSHIIIMNHHSSNVIAIITICINWTKGTPPSPGATSSSKGSISDIIKSSSRY